MRTIVVIGAGPAGLTAAYELLKISARQRIVILEASDAIGGISRTVGHRGNRMDIGGHRFFSKNESVMAWWKEMLPLQGAPSYDDKKLDRRSTLAESGPDPEIADGVMLVRHRVSRIFYLRKFFPYPVTLNMHTLKSLGFARTLKVGFSYLHACFVKRKERNLEDFLVNRFGWVLYRMFFENYTEKVWGKHPSRISASWGKQRIRGLSLVRMLLNILKKTSSATDAISQKNKETSLIEEFMYPKYGPGQLWETVAEKIKSMGGEIRLKATVNRFQLENGLVKTVGYERAGAQEEIACDACVSSMAIKDLIEGLPRDAVPETVRDVAGKLPYRDFITVGLLVSKLNLKNTTTIRTLNNIVPDCWIYVQEEDVHLGRLQIFNNWSPYMVGDPDKTVWIGLEYFCNENDRLWNMGDDEYIEMAITELVKLGIVERRRVLESVRIKVKKAYPAYFDAYERFGTVRQYLDTLRNLYCIGRNGQHRYNNMDHSMLTAMEAVANITNDVASKDNIWSVNTEEEYHEQKRP